MTSKQYGSQGRFKRLQTSPHPESVTKIWAAQGSVQGAASRHRIWLFQGHHLTYMQQLGNRRNSKGFKATLSLKSKIYAGLSKSAFDANSKMPLIRMNRRSAPRFSSRAPP